VTRQLMLAWTSAISNGPSATPALKLAPYQAVAATRARPGYAAPSNASPQASTAAAPAPCTTRAAISSQASGAAAASAENAGPAAPAAPAALAAPAGPVGRRPHSLRP